MPADRRLILKAGSDAALLGFVCVLLDAEPKWGARLDNLHVSPESKGSGIGYALFQAAREWIVRVAPARRCIFGASSAITARAASMTDKAAPSLKQQRDS